jgi:hypothetical protein
MALYNYTVMISVILRPLYFDFVGYLLGSEGYYSHKREGYLDLRDQNGPLHNYTGVYSAFAFTEQAVDVIQKHDKSKVRSLIVSITF